MLLHNKVMSVVGILGNDVDPMVSVMKVDQAPTESYADVGGLETQIQVRPRQGSVWTARRVAHVACAPWRLPRTVQMHVVGAGRGRAATLDPATAARGS